MIRMTILYPKTSESRFDLDYYLNHHLALVQARLYGLLVRAETDVGIDNALSDQPAPYHIVGYALFNTLEDMQTGLAAHGAEIMADIPNFSNVQPQIQIGSVVE